MRVLKRSSGGCSSLLTSGESCFRASVLISSRSLEIGAEGAGGLTGADGAITWGEL